MQKYNLKLISTVLVASSAIAGGEIQEVAYEKIYASLNQMVKTLNKTFQEFLSVKNNDSIAIHLEQFKELKKQIEQELADLETSARTNPALMELVSYGKDILKQLVAFISVVEEFKGKSPALATQFATKLQKTIDIQKTFNEVIAKLQGLQTRYSVQDKKFSELQLKLITCLQAIAKQWEAKSKTVLLSALQHRMSCKNK